MDPIKKSAYDCFLPVYLILKAANKEFAVTDNPVETEGSDLKLRKPKVIGQDSAMKWFATSAQGAGSEY